MNLDHLAILNQSIAAWNKWRIANPSIKVDLDGADLSRANLSRADLSGASLSWVNLEGACLSNANLDGAELSRANLSKANLYRANLSWVNLEGAQLSDVNLDGGNLREANLVGAKLIGARLIAANLEEADLTRANLEVADLTGARLDGAHLEGVNLSGADLNGANFNGAHLEGADLSGADLNGANLTGAHLEGANLSRAHLYGTNLSRTNLSEANFSESWLAETIFADVNLAVAKNLDACRYGGPSILDFRTLQQSSNLPLVFLRGCGLPDLLINYLPSLLNQPIQFYSCFISYSSQDEDFAQRLHADLQNKGVRCWFAPEDIKGGRKLHEQIGEAIRLHEKLLLVLSEYSMNSEWVKTEIAKARQREGREQRKVLFPIRLVDFNTIKQWECFDADAGKDSAREIREYFIPDFSNWKDHDAYQQAFDRLLRDLRTEIERKPIG